MSFLSGLLASVLTKLIGSLAGWLLMLAQRVAEKSKDEKDSAVVREIVENAKTRQELIEAARRNAANTP